jgi:hypothetical protein
VSKVGGILVFRWQDVCWRFNSFGEANLWCLKNSDRAAFSFPTGKNIQKFNQRERPHPGGKGHWRRKRHRNTSSAREKSRAERQKGLQICGEGTVSRKMRTLFVGKKSHGKYQIKCTLDSNANP